MAHFAKVQNGIVTQVIVAEPILTKYNKKRTKCHT